VPARRLDFERGLEKQALRWDSWITRPKLIRVSIRAFDAVDDGRRFTGFRCVGDDIQDAPETSASK